MIIYELGTKKNIDEKMLSESGGIKSLIESKKNHLIILDIDEFRDMSGDFGYPERAIHETLDSNQMPNAEFFDDLLFITLNDIVWADENKKNLTSNEINIYFSKGDLIIVRHRDTDSFRRCAEKTDKGNIYKALYSFLDAVMENDKKMTSEIEHLTLSLEKKVLEMVRVGDKAEGSDEKYTDPDVYMREIVNMQNHLQFLKTYYEPTADILEIIEVDDSELIPEEFDKYFLKLSLKADRLSNGLLNLSGYISQAREAWQAQVDLEFNKIMKTFTVITAVFLPLTLIAGWYGMNFRVFPEIGWYYGYHMVIILSIAVVVISLWYFKKKHYI